jgi:predicted dehydrogenase
MSEPVRFAIVGTGAIAQSYAVAFEVNPHAQLVAVVDLNRAAAAKFGERFAVPVFETHLELLESGLPVEAVIVCTPPNTHEAITIDIVRRGIHVLCEKPFAIAPDSARRMVRAAKQTGAMLTMGSKFRYVTDMIRAKEFIANGLVGEVILFENAFTSRAEMSGRWNSNPTISGGGVLIDNGTHSVDIIRYFLGPLSEVHAIEGKRVQGLAVEDTARLFVRATCGIMGTVDLSWSMNKELDWYVTIYGTKGIIQVGWKQSRYKLNGSEWTVFGQGYDKAQAFRSQVQNFALAIRGQEPLIITWEDAVASVEVITSAYQSMRSAPWTGVSQEQGLLATPRPITHAELFREVRRV